MHRAKIGIVEDELLISNYIKNILEAKNYKVPEACKNYREAVDMLETEKPDLVILDIRLEGENDGVAVAEYIRENSDIPFIFETSKNDDSTLERVLKVKPSAFLTKPFQEKDLLIAIELALHNFSNQTTSISARGTDNYVIKDSFFVKDGQQFHKIRFDQVFYIEGDGAYIALYTEKKKFLIRGSIAACLEKMNSNKFIRVHRSFAVNIDKIDCIVASYLIINEQQIPISKNFREELFAAMNIK